MVGLLTAFPYESYKIAVHSFIRMHSNFNDSRMPILTISKRYNFN